jgi:hypothetical protein
MEAVFQADRSLLRDLLQTRPDLSLKQMAQIVKRSYTWAKDWAKRLAAAPPDDLEVLQSRSRARHSQPSEWDPLVLRRIEQIRLHPPENLQRTPGPRAILYYLPRDAELQEKGCRLPKSTSTVWQMLTKLGLITQKTVIVHQEGPQRGLMEEIQADFNDPGLPPDPSGEGKKQHVAEVFNFVDAGSSILLKAKVHPDYHAQTALEAIIEFLWEYGCPRRFSLDHDPRFLGGPGGWDFPSPLVRFLRTVRVGVRICPVHQPQKNAYVERYHRTYKYECIEVHKPQNLEELRRVTEEFQHHYNVERPHQGRSCGNRPPMTAFPDLPKLPPLPETVQADRWLWDYHHQVLARLVGSDGCVTVDQETYYVATSMVGRKVALLIDAPTASFDVLAGTTVLKRIPIKGVIRGEMPIEKFISLMLEQARSEERKRLARQASWWQRGLWDPTP